MTGGDLEKLGYGLQARKGLVALQIRIGPQGFPLP